MSGGVKRPKVHIFIDNSNVYIQGAKIYTPGSNQDSVSDMSWRYDVAKLRDVLLNNSGLQANNIGEEDAHTTVYGSVPPPGGVWEKFASKNITVHKYDRSHHTGREKQVNLKMGVDITDRAIRDEVGGIQSEFIVVTGDADLLPAVQKINQSGFRAHVWSWSKGFSTSFRAQYNEMGQQSLYLRH